MGGKQMIIKLNQSIKVAVTFLLIVFLFGCDSIQEGDENDCNLNPTHTDCLDDEDLTNPIFSNLPLDFAITKGTEIDLLSLGLTASDDTDGDLTDNISVDILDTSILEIGIHTVTYSVSDESGNSTSIYLTLTIESRDWISLGYEIFDVPDESIRSDKAKVIVNGENVFVYETRVNHNHTWTWNVPNTMNDVALFDFNESVEVVIVFDEVVGQVVVRPLATNVAPTISGNIITFTLSEPQAYVVEINGDTDNVVHLFTNYIDDDKPDPNNLPSDMIYFGPGVHDVGTVTIHSNEEVYIAGGAVIHGRFKGYNVHDVTIRGRGIITGENYIRDENNWSVPYEFIRSSNLVIDGVTFLDPAGWVINSNFNTDVVINRINIITARSNGDGVSIQSNHNVLVTNSFVRSWDDSLVVKNYQEGTTSNIVFDNITIWTDLAQSMEVGYETYGATMDNITFENITIIHNFHLAAISIHNGDQALISNVVFRNIIIEDAQMTGENLDEDFDDILIDITIVYVPHWSTSSIRGNVENILITNVVVLNARDGLKIRVIGYDDTHLVTRVTIRGLIIEGVAIDEITDMEVITNSYVEDLVFS
jgi:hypothetical protein